MIWFLSAATLILAAALALPQGRSRRRGLEASVLLVAALPVLRWLTEASAVPLIAGDLADVWQEHTGPFMTQAVLITWCVGVAVGLIRVARQAARLKRLSLDAVSLTDETSAQVCRVLGLTKIAVATRFWQSRQVTAPLVLPTMPAKVLLPAEWDAWPHRLQVAALKHEWHHLRMGDAWWQVGMRLFRTALWFHPLAWRVTAVWLDECEAGADRAAVGSDGAADYCDDLLSLRAGSPRSPAMALGFYSGSGSRLSRRIERLLRPARTAGEQGAAAKIFLLLALAIGCAWIGARRAQEADLRQEAHMRLSAEAFPADL